MKGFGPVFALFTVASTLIGGFVGLRLRHRLSGVMAFTGGVVLGVALLDVLPESFQKLGTGRTVGVAVASGFLGFFILSRILILHHRDDPARAAGHHQVGALGAAALSVHSFLDGFGLGAVDALAPLAGAIVGAFVVASDRVFGIGLGVYAGIFLAIGAGELLPEAHSEPSAGRIALTIVGFSLLFVISHIAKV